MGNRNPRAGWLTSNANLGLKTETHIYDKMRRILQPHCHFQRLEMPSASGVPDMLISKGGRSIAVEAKVINSQSTLTCKFQTGQPNWIRSWELNGNKAFILAWRRDTEEYYLLRLGEVLPVPMQLKKYLEQGRSQDLTTHCESLIKILVGG